MSHERDGCWNGWGEQGYDAYTDPSAASTPCGSPMHHTGGHGNGVFLPMDAMQGMPPPLPGMGGDTPYGTPMSSNYGSFAGSPCMSPGGQGGMMAVQGSPQMQYNGTMVAAPAPQLPSLPSWPFTGPAIGNVQQAPTPGGDMGMPQLYSVQPSGVPMMPQGGATPTMGNMMPDGSCVGSGAATPTSCMPGGSPTSWQCQSSQPQQSPFPMPLSPPHDLAQPCAPTGSQPQQAFFQVMPESGGQASNGQMCNMGGDNPFCL